MKKSNHHDSQQWHRWFLGAVLICVMAMALPTPIHAQPPPPFIYSTMRNNVNLRFNLGPNAQAAAEQLVNDVNEAIGDTQLFLLSTVPGSISLRQQHNMRRYDTDNEVVIGSGHSVSLFLGLLVYDVIRGGTTLLGLSRVGSNPRMFQYLDDLSIIEIPVGKAADDLVCQLRRKLAVLDNRGVETFQQEWKFSSDDLGEIEFGIRFQRAEPMYIPSTDEICDFQEDYLGYRFRSAPNRLVMMSRRGTRYPLDISLLKLNCHLNDPLLNEIFGDRGNEFVLPTQDLGELFMQELISQ